MTEYFCGHEMLQQGSGCFAAKEYTMATNATSLTIPVCARRWAVCVQGWRTASALPMSEVAAAPGVLSTSTYFCAALSKSLEEECEQRQFCGRCACAQGQFNVAPRAVSEVLMSH